MRKRHPSKVVNPFASKGYFVAHTVLDARDHGAAHRRRRWWAVAVRVNDEGALTVEQGCQLKKNQAK